MGENEAFLRMVVGIAIIAAVAIVTFNYYDNETAIKMADKGYEQCRDNGHTLWVKDCATYIKNR